MVIASVLQGRTTDFLMNRSRTEELELPSLSVYIYMFKGSRDDQIRSRELREGLQRMHVQRLQRRKSSELISNGMAGDEALLS